MPLIAPSVLSADFSDLRSQLAAVERGGADWIHLDVMDGHFVPNLTIGPPVIASLRKCTALPFDTHLMIENPERYLERFRAAGADIITVHQETCRPLHRTLQAIRALGARPGVSINPATPVQVLADVVAEVDLVLIMTVNPGFGGQAFIPDSLEKIGAMAAMIRERKPGVLLEVDGGIDPVTAPRAVAAGATVLVAGNAIFGTPDPAAAVRTLRAAVS